MIHGLHAGEHDAQTGDVVQAGRALRVLRRSSFSRMDAGDLSRNVIERTAKGVCSSSSCIRAAQSERNAVSTAAL